MTFYIKMVDPLRHVQINFYHVYFLTCWFGFSRVYAALLLLLNILSSLVNTPLN